MLQRYSSDPNREIKIYGGQTLPALFKQTLKDDDELTNEAVIESHQSSSKSVKVSQMANAY